MKEVGIIILIGGIIGGLATSQMSTTTGLPASTTIGLHEKVHNIGLIADREIAFEARCCVSLIGAIFIGLGALNETLLQNTTQPKEQSKTELEERDKGDVERRKMQLEAELQKRRAESIRARDALDAQRKKRNEKAGKLTRSIAKLPHRFDRMLFSVAGKDNEYVIVYRFLQILCYVGLPALAIVVILLLRT